MRIVLGMCYLGYNLYVVCRLGILDSHVMPKIGEISDGRAEDT